MGKSETIKIYSIEGSLEGKVLYIVAPGPSLSGFPIEKLAGKYSIALNSAIEFFNPTWWMFTDKKIFRRYLGHIKKNPNQSIATIKNYVNGIRRRGFEGDIYEFEYQCRVLRRVENKDPWWWWDEINFLPGRTTVSCNALSFAQILRPKKIILVGIDFFVVGGKYYTDGVRMNPGPRDKKRALKSGANWMRKGFKKKIWTLDTYTTSIYLRSYIGDYVKYITVEEAVNDL